MADREKVISLVEDAIEIVEKEAFWTIANGLRDAIALLKEQNAVVHPEPSCVMKYITDCCCDLCGVQLIREDNFCRCCGKRIEWEGSVK